MKRIPALFFGIAILLSALLPALCLGAGARPASAPGQDKTLAELFARRGAVGCLVVETGQGRLAAVEADPTLPARARTPFRPASTFKVVNAAVALEAGVATPQTLMRWDGVAREYPAWNRDLTLAEAFRASAVWYFVELGKRNGRARLKSAMDALGFGNADASGSDQFWIDGPLRITAEEQAAALRRLLGPASPFAPATLAALREIMLLEKGEDAKGPYALYGKTGLALESGDPLGRPVGWLVGFVERREGRTVFALNLSDAAPGQATLRPELVRARLEIAREALVGLGVLPAAPAQAR